MDKNFVILWIAVPLIVCLGVVGLNLAEALKSDYKSCLDQRTREVSRGVPNPIICECNP